MFSIELKLIRDCRFINDHHVLILATHFLNEIFFVPYPKQLHQIDGVNVIHDLFSN